MNKEGNNRIHKKQFLIGQKPKKIKEDWKTVALSERFYLSYCPELLVGNVKDLDGESWYLLGIATQTDKEKGDPLTEISHSKTEDVRNLYKAWNGRWLLIGNAEIHMDYSGVLGCFYTEINNEKWVSSSLAILQEMGGFTPRAENLKHKSGLEWYYLPMTRFEEISKLLPSQILHLKTFYLEPRQLPGPIKGISYAEILEKLESRMKHSLENLSKMNLRIFVALSSGYDSRLLLAVAHDANINFETYTQEHKYITNSDVKLPPKLSKTASVRHRYIKESGFSAKKEQLYDAHTARDIDDADRKMFPNGQWDSFGKGDVILRGGIFGISKCYGYDWFDPTLNIETLLKKYRHENNPNSFQVKALTKWINWVNENPTEGLDWRDRYYLEQRVGGWQSAIEQSLDITGTERYYPINSFEIMSLMLSIPEEKRRAKQHHIDLIRKMLPELLQFPFNPPNPPPSILKRIRKKIERMIK